MTHHSMDQLGSRHHLIDCATAQLLSVGFCSAKPPAWLVVSDAAVVKCHHNRFVHFKGSTTVCSGPMGYSGWAQHTAQGGVCLQHG
jgi:hypothetical protein